MKTVWVRCFKTYLKNGDLILDNKWGLKAIEDNNRWIIEYTKNSILGEVNITVTNEDFKKHFKIISEDENLNEYIVWSSHYWYRTIQRWLNEYRMWHLKCNCGQLNPINVNRHNKLIYSNNRDNIYRIEVKCQNCNEMYVIDVDIVNQKFHFPDVSLEWVSIIKQNGCSYQYYYCGDLPELPACFKFPCKIYQFPKKVLNN